MYLPYCRVGKGRPRETASREACEKGSHRHFHPDLNTKDAYCDLLINHLLAEMESFSLL